MSRLTGSVGAKGRNRPGDVKKVQTALNRWQDDIDLDKPLGVDGLMGRITLLAIVEFQGRIVGMVEPDGRVDPGGRTWKLLKGKTPVFKMLPKNGNGYYAYGKDARRFGTTKTLASVKKAALAMQEIGLEIGVGNISLQQGGQIPPHTSHQRGVDVDFRPQRSDQRRLGVTLHDTPYSRTDTRKLVKILRQDSNLEMILFNDSAITGVVRWDGHDNHLHVRYKQ